MTQSLPFLHDLLVLCEPLSNTARIKISKKGSCVTRTLYFTLSIPVGYTTLQFNQKLFIFFHKTTELNIWTQVSESE